MNGVIYIYIECVENIDGNLSGLLEKKVKINL